ncbi:hypothetical protein Tco_1384686 [Tanacetum coccineum]
MTTLKFADTHNMVAFLAKPAESEGFEQIVDFLNAHTIKYALTVNPTIYTSCIEQFWATVKAKTVNGEVQLQALVDGKKIIITESIVRRDLQLEDVEGVDSTNQKFNFSKYIFESMAKNLDNAVKFWMYPRSRRPKRKDTQVPQSSVPSDNVVDEVINEEMDDSLVRAATTTSLDAEQRGCHIEFLDLENIKTAQAQEITSLKLRVKKLEKKRGSRTHKLKRLYKVGRSARMISSDKTSLGDQEDASKQERKINDIDKDAKITLVDETQGRYGDDLMFDTSDLTGEEVFVAEQGVPDSKKDDVVSTAGVAITVSDAATTVPMTFEEITLAQALEE